MDQQCFEFTTEPNLRALLEKSFQLSSFRPGQEEIIRTVISGQDTLVLMPTGGGKSLCYQLSAMALPGITLIISPLIALMKDQVDGLKEMSLPAEALHSGLTLDEQKNVYQSLNRGTVKMLFVAPERLKNKYFRGQMSQLTVSLVAVDEAHCISEWGHDFRPDYVRIPSTLKFLGSPPVIALTATATPEVRHDIIKQLDLTNPATFMKGFDRPNLYYEVEKFRYDTEKDRFLLHFCQRFSGPGIIYAATRKKVDQVGRLLQSRGLRCGTYHAGLDDEERSEIQELFMAGEIDIIAATNAFGMGIDKRNIRFVIHYNFPRTLEALAQESGRAGRDGLDAHAILLYSPKDKHIQEFFIDLQNPPEAAVRQVYKTLLRLGRGKLELTYLDIAKLVSDKKINDGMIASGVKLLEDQSFIRRMDNNEKAATIFIPENKNSLLDSLSQRAEARSKLILYLVRAPKRLLRVTLEDLADDVGIKREALLKELNHLAKIGKIQYEPPFRGRGLFIPEEPPDWQEFDYSVIREKKEHEQEKLETVMKYCHTRGCRRDFILRYFEDPNPTNCGNCDYCAGEKRTLIAAEADKDDMLSRIVEIGRNEDDKNREGIIVRLVQETRQRYGKGMIIDVLAGSKKKALLQKKLHTIDAYASLKHLKRDEIEKIINSMVRDRLLRVSGPRRYPVLKLNDR
jgi:ATP-dependent DNA helicase RecQ